MIDSQISRSIDMNRGDEKLTFPERGSNAFIEITSSSPSLEKFLRIMRGRPAMTIAERADLYRQVVLNQIHEDVELNFEQDVEHDIGPEWTDMGLETSEENWAAIDVQMIEDHDATKNEQPVTLSDSDDSGSEGNLMSIEDIGEELQMKVLELKGALHKEEPRVEVSFLLETQGDVLACIAHDLSTLPTNQICVLLKSFLAEKSNRMLQCDLALLFRHLIFAHLKQPSAVAGAKLLSYGADLASRWSRLFVENILLPSLRDLKGTLETFLKRSLKAIEDRESAQALIILFKSLGTDGGRLTIENVDQVMGLTEVLVANCRDLDADVVVELRAVYRMHESTLHKNRTFAKNLLDIVKRTKDLEPHKAIVSEILSTMTHPMKSIIQKLIVPKAAAPN